MNLSGNDKNKITGKKYQPVMSITGLNDQGHKKVEYKPTKILIYCIPYKRLYFFFCIIPYYAVE